MLDTPTKPLCPRLAHERFLGFFGSLLPLLFWRSIIFLGAVQKTQLEQYKGVSYLLFLGF